MDIASHGLWGGVAFGRKNRKNFWSAFLFGIFPDLASFGMYFAGVSLGIYAHPKVGHPADLQIPELIHTLYNWSHSLFVFSIVFLIVWIFLKKPFFPMLAWPLHIVFDIFTHTKEFFPTPFLWPVSDVKLSVINWSEPEIYIPNLLLLVLFYGLFLWRKRKQEVKNS